MSLLLFERSGVTTNVKLVSPIYLEKKYMLFTLLHGRLLGSEPQMYQLPSWTGLTATHRHMYRNSSSKFTRNSENTRVSAATAQIASVSDFVW